MFCYLLTLNIMFYKTIKKHTNFYRFLKYITYNLKRFQNFKNIYNLKNIYINI